MANGTHTLREVIDSGYVLVMGAGPGPEGVSLVVWNRAQSFNVWMSVDGCSWENTHVLTYDPEGRWPDAQHWAAHRLALLMGEHPG